MSYDVKDNLYALNSFFNYINDLARLLRKLVSTEMLPPVYEFKY